MMTGLGENIGKAAKVLGIHLDPGHGNGGVKEGSAEGAEDQVKTHCSQVGPHLGTRVPMGTFFRF